MQHTHTTGCVRPTIRTLVIDLVQTAPRVLLFLLQLLLQLTNEPHALGPSRRHHQLHCWNTSRRSEHSRGSLFLVVDVVVCRAAAAAASENVEQVAVTRTHCCRWPTEQLSLEREANKSN